MKTALRLLCGAALALTLVPSCLVFGGWMGSGLMKPLMLAGTVLWFAAATALSALPREPRG